MKIITSAEALPEGALQLANTDDVLARADEIRAHGAVVLQFPKWTDGRAYSQAVLLRGRLRYAGTLVAIGDVVADMSPLLRRCGFDVARLRAGQRLETAERTLGHFDAHYQSSLAERHATPAEESRLTVSAAPNSPAAA